MRLAVLLLACALAGCLESSKAPETPPPSSPAPAAGRDGDPHVRAMEAYLRGPYPRADAVEWERVRVTRIWNVTVGDVPLVGIEAAINAEGKQAIAYFWASNLTPVLTPGTYVPSYQELTSQPMGYDLVVALRAANATDVLESLVELRPPPGMPATQERPEDAQRARALSRSTLENVTREVRALEGVEHVGWDENASHPGFLLRATPEAIRAVAARPDVASLDVNHVGRGTWDAQWG